MHPIPHAESCLTHGWEVPTVRVRALATGDSKTGIMVMGTQVAEDDARGALTVPDDLVFLALERHALRRRQAIPTLSVLVGNDPQAGFRRWQAWAAASAEPLQARTLPWSRAAADLPPVTERGDAWCCVPPTPDDATARSLSPAQRAARLGQAVSSLVQRLERSAGWPIALCVATEDAAAFLRDAPPSRAKAFFCEGLLSLDCALSASPENPGSTQGQTSARSATALAAACRVLGRAAIPGFGSPLAAARLEATACALDAAQASSEKTADAVTPSDDHARSAAERFLFELLEALPDTAGVFTLNAPLENGVCFGVKRAEVDLLARGPRLAVEIDGYRHFTDPAAYRRDRRKDALLQQQGYFVLRFLAADVVARLEEILEEIRAVLVFRRVAGIADGGLRIAE